MEAFKQMCSKSPWINNIWFPLGQAIRIVLQAQRKIHSTGLIWFQKALW